jgi:hypothetical protein
MSRITPPVTKFTHILRRSISSSANAGRPSGLLDSQARASRYLPGKLKDLKAQCSSRGISKNGNKAELVDRLAAHDIVGSKIFHTMGNHRPPMRQQSMIRTIPSMQGFQTSAPKQAARDSSTIDFFFFPEVSEPEANPFGNIRVPLLPDNYNPNRGPGSAHAKEVLDEAVPGPQISIVAAHPEYVIPATISEVVGNDGLDVNLEFLTAGFSPPAMSESKSTESGIFKELWSGITDDLFGPKGPSAKVAV